MSPAILTLNAGSSSLKFAVYRADGETVERLAHGQIDGLGGSPRLFAADANGVTLAERAWDESHTHGSQDVLSEVLAIVEPTAGPGGLSGVGHRVVHGGAAFSGPVRLTPETLAQITALRPLAPLHQPQALAVIAAVQALRPNLPQAACFDTAFHQTHAEVVTRFALPREWHDRGVRRYGFHGLSYAYVAGRLRELAPALADRKVVVAHLGAGASLCVLDRGRSVDTTMGFTALDGLVMATRCGGLDPGVTLYMQQEAGLGVAEVEDLLYKRSGLLGVSGVSGDMRELLASPAPAAREAIELFVHRIARETGALMSVAGGLDGFVFTGGIGEHAAAIRQAVADRLAWTGLSLDAQANGRGGAGRISTPSSRIEAWVVPTDEETMIARQSLQVLAAALDA